MLPYQTDNPFPAAAPQCDELHDLLVSFNDAVFGADEPAANEARELLAENFGIRADYDLGRFWYANSQHAALTAGLDRVEVYRHLMRCTMYRTEQTAEAIARFATIA